MIDSVSGLTATNPNKVFLNGNAKVFTEYLQEICGKKDIKIAAFGDHALNDIYATHEFSKKSDSEAKWENIAVVNEFSFLNKDFDLGEDP
jgi:hypothetical protein